VTIVEEGRDPFGAPAEGVSMEATQAPVQSGDLSPAKSRALVVAALAAALLGLTVLDVETSQVTPHTAKATRSIDCIVASAVFAGVVASLP